MSTRDCPHITATSSPARGEAGRTGDWRVNHPEIDVTVCTPSRTGRPSCFICWMYCPDAVISRTVPPKIDLEFCKGCGICAEECPTNAITMVADSEEE